MIENSNVIHTFCEEMVGNEGSTRSEVLRTSVEAPRGTRSRSAPVCCFQATQDPVSHGAEVRR